MQKTYRNNPRLLIALAGLILVLAGGLHQGVRSQDTGGAFAVTGETLASGLVEGTTADIVMRNDLVAVSISTGSFLDPQLGGSAGGNVTLGRILDAAPTDGADQLDWINTAYLESSRTNGFQLYETRYDNVTIVDAGPAQAVVEATGYRTADPSILVTTTYTLDPDVPYLNISTRVENTSANPVSLWTGDILDYDGAGQSSFLPGFGAVTSAMNFDPAERWVAQWGASDEAYALVYDNFLKVYALPFFDATQLPIDVDAGASRTFSRRLLIVSADDSAEDALRAVIDTLPSPDTASVTIEVIDDINSTPVVGAHVSLTAGNRSIPVATGSTNASGQLVVNLPPWRYGLQISAPGFDNFGADLEVVDGSSAHTYRLSPGTGVRNVILVIGDGMGWPRMQEIDAISPLPGLTRMVEEGAVSVHGVAAVPSLTLTNWYTILTGAHPDDTGEVANVFIRSVSPPMDTLENVAAREGLSYRLTSSESAIDEIIAEVGNGTLPNIRIAWDTSPDGAGHIDGPGSAQFENAIRVVDGKIDQLMNAIVAAGMFDSTVIMVGADHGMEELTADGTLNTLRKVDVGAVLDAADIDNEWRGSGPRMGHVYLEDPEEADAAIAVLRATEGIDANVFKRGELTRLELPNDYVIELNSPNSGDVVSFMLPGYSNGRTTSPFYWDTSDNVLGGHGGLSLEEMHVPWLMWGGAIKPGFTMGPKHQVDHAATITALLGVEPPLFSEGMAAVEAFRPVGQPLSIRAVDLESALAAPTSTLDVFVTLENDSVNPVDVTVNLTPPTGWSATPPAPLVLAPFATRTAIGSVTIPAGTSAGDYVLGIEVTSAQGHSEASSLEVTVANWMTVPVQVLENSGRDRSNELIDTIVTLPPGVNGSNLLAVDADGSILQDSYFEAAGGDSWRALFVLPALAANEVRDCFIAYTFDQVAMPSRRPNPEVRAFLAGDIRFQNEAIAGEVFVSGTDLQLAGQGIGSLGRLSALFSRDIGANELDWTNVGGFDSWQGWNSWMDDEVDVTSAAVLSTSGIAFFTADGNLASNPDIEVHIEHAAWADKPYLRVRLTYTNTGASPYALLPHYDVDIDPNPNAAFYIDGGSWAAGEPTPTGNRQVYGLVTRAPADALPVTLSNGGGLYLAVRDDSVTMDPRASYTLEFWIAATSEGTTSFYGGIEQIAADIETQPLAD